jgi:trimeric autotransporter adhesin
MASTYVNDLRLNEMATGDASGSWGTVTNTNLELIGEAFSYGTETIGDANSTLTIADGAADAARSFYLKITSSVDLTTTRIVTLGPNTVSKVWMIENATTGSQVITIKQGSGATINVPNGQVKMISTDGAGSGGAVLDLLVDVDLTGTTTLVNLNVSGAVDIAGDLTLSAGGDGALRFTAASSVKVLDNNAAALVFEEADNAYMTFVTTDGSEAVKFDKALDINAATQIDATVTVGVDDTGYDVKFFGATTGKSLLWDESADSLIVTGTTTLVGTTNLDAVDIDGATQIDATVTVGVDDTGYDVKFFGATAGAYMLWDESADDLILGGAAGLSVNSTALVTGVLTTTAATVSNGGGQFNGAINVGVDDTGYDVKFFGATTGKSLLWDESADSLTVSGNLSVDGGTIKLDGNYPVGTGNVALGDTALDSNVSGASNVAIGADALTANTASNNTAVGYQAMYLNTTGANSTGVGYQAGYNNTTGQIYAFGNSALFSNTTGTLNTAVGGASLYANTTGGNNVAVGQQALAANTTADNNTAVGYQAGYSGTTATQNVLIGSSAGYAITTGGYNVAIGHSAGSAITTSTGNVMVGVQAGVSTTTGICNTFVGGSYSGYVGGSNTTGSSNTALGSDALKSNTTASNNTAVGFQAGYANTTGHSNTSVGKGAFYTNTTGVENNAFGFQALYSNTTGSTNTALGRNTLYTNTEGNQSVAVGNNSLYYNTTGSNNTAVGYLALTANTTASDNTAVGYLALTANTTGTENTAVGKGSLDSNTTARYNTGIGHNSLDANTTGEANSAIGRYSMFSNTTGGNNSAFGVNALYSNTSASNNTAVGYQSLFANTTGATNTAVGDSALQSVTTGSGNVGVGQASGGQGAMINITTESNRAVFGHNSITNAYVKVAFTVTSDARDKMNFEEVPHGLSFVNQLKPVKFNFKKSRENATPHGRTKYGFKAQDILALEGDNPIIIDDENEDSLKAVESHLLPVLTKAIQELSAQVTALTARLTTLEGE